MNSELRLFLAQKLGATLSEFLEQKVKKNGVQLSISKSRKTKLGDYRFNFKNLSHKITLNEDLSKAQFFLTFLHELAHKLNHELNGFKVAPHGIEWKLEFRKLLFEAQQLNLDPETSELVQQTMAKPTARTLLPRKEYNGLKVRDLKQGDKFNLINSEKTFSLGSKKRTRYHCIELTSGLSYSVLGDAPVEKINNKNEE